MHNFDKIVRFVTEMSFIDLAAGVFYVYLAWRNVAFSKENHARFFDLSLLSGTYFIFSANSITVVIHLNR